MFKETLAARTVCDAPTATVTFSPPTTHRSAARPACTLRAGVRVPLDAIRDAGAYVCNWSGHLLRVPQRGLTPEGSLAVNIVGGEPLIATKISDDPQVPIARARSLAWSFGLSVGF